MHKSATKPCISAMALIAAIAFFVATAAVSLNAQQLTGTKPVDLRAELSAPLNLAAPPSPGYSSSRAGVAETAAAEFFDGQYPYPPPPPPPPPPPYRRRTNYSDSIHNPDGSNKYAFSVGGGFTLPVGGTHSYYSPNWDFQFGVGRNVNRDFGVMLNFNWANFGIQHSLLDAVSAAAQTQIGGHGHVWSFSIDPRYNLVKDESSSVYVTGGVGIYHKVTTFTVPGQSCYYDYYYGYVCYQTNQPITSFPPSNAVGFNLGFGYAHGFSRFANEQFYVEARYVYTANSRRPNGPFPLNADPTTYIPITFGIRF